MDRGGGGTLARHQMRSSPENESGAENELRTIVDQAYRLRFSTHRQNYPRLEALVIAPQLNLSRSAKN